MAVLASPAQFVKPIRLTDTKPALPQRTQYAEIAPRVDPASTVGGVVGILQTRGCPINAQTPIVLVVLHAHTINTWA